MRPRADSRHILDQDLINQRRVPMQTRQNDFIQCLTKPQNDAPFLLIHRVNAHHQVDDQEHGAGQAQQCCVQRLTCPAATGCIATATAEHLRQILLQLAECLIEVRWSFVVAIAPGILITPVAASWFIPCHLFLPSFDKQELYFPTNPTINLQVFRPFSHIILPACPG